MDEYSPPEPDHIWLRYGLKQSPYSTLPMRLVGSVPIESVFSGRKNEVILLKRVIKSSNSTRNLIVGQYGVGKTTFSNFVRWNLCLKNKESKYLTTSAEIKIQKSWDARKFLFATLSAIYSSSIVFAWSKKGLKFKSISKIKQIVDWLSNINISGGVIGTSAGFGKSKSAPPEISNETMESALNEFCQELLDKNKEIIIQYDNLENIEWEELADLLKNIREYLQIEGLHSLFLGPPQTISALEKHGQVHSTFSKPILLDPLGSEDVVIILEKRCNALKVGEGSYFKPYHEETVKKLYTQLMNIRFTFKVLEDTTALADAQAPCEITMEDVESVQKKEKEEILSKLKENEVKVISTLLSGEKFSVSDLADKTKIGSTNISPIIKSLKNKGLIIEEVNSKDKRIKFVKITDASYLRLSFSATPKSEKQNSLEGY